MAEFEIRDGDLASLKDKVIIVTGGSSGIGLGTTTLLLSLGAKVVMSDLSPPPMSLEDQQNLTYVKVDVTDWVQLSGLFKRAKETHGRIDHVFANAGITVKKSYLEDEIDENGELLPPDFSVITVNLLSVVSTVKLALYYLKNQEDGGSIVTTASVSSFTRFAAVDYATAKHGVLGLTRSLCPRLDQKMGIRLNSIAPNWTETAIVPRAPLESLGFNVNTPEQVARATALLMADDSRHGELIFVDGGTYKEIEKPVMESIGSIIGGEKDGEDLKAYHDFMTKMNSVLGVKSQSS